MDLSVKAYWAHAHGRRQERGGVRRVALRQQDEEIALATRLRPCPPAGPPERERERERELY